MSNSDTNLNAQVLAALNRLANTLALLDETTSVQSCALADDDCDDLIKGTAAMSIAEEDDDNTQKRTDNDFIAQLKATQQLSVLPSESISHWRTLPPNVSSAYQLLVDGASYIHATSTKYTLISNTGHNQESGNLAVELRKGAELLGTGTLLLFSESCGSSRSLKHYVKLHARAVVASVVSLLQYFEDAYQTGGNELKNCCNNNIGAQKTGAIWSACDKLTSSLPRGNRAAMRRDLMVWMRDCNDSIAEFEELVLLGPKIKEQVDDDDDDDDEQYTAEELMLAKACVNLMKCSKNVLNLVMSACECVGDHLETLSSRVDEDASSQGSKDTKKNEMLQYICKLHDRARLIGVGVTNFGVLLYPPFDLEMDAEEVNEWLSKKSNFSKSISIPNLVITPLGLELDGQLHAMLECVESVHSAGKMDGFTAIEGCISKDVVDMSERLLNAVHIRCKEIEEAIYW